MRNWVFDFFLTGLWNCLGLTLQICDSTLQCPESVGQSPGVQTVLCVRSFHIVDAHDLFFSISEILEINLMPSPRKPLMCLLHFNILSQYHSLDLSETILVRE